MRIEKIGVCRRRTGQALLEVAILGLLLAALLAGVLDFGRAYYTSIVVTQMAGEGVAYAAWYPDRDVDYAPGTCSHMLVTTENTIQERARLVAVQHGMVIQPSQATISILNTNGSTSTCATRCAGSSLKVKVTYRITDLFLPSLLGIRSITISRSATELVMRDAYAAEGTCGP